MKIVGADQGTTVLQVRADLGMMICGFIREVDNFDVAWLWLVMKTLAVRGTAETSDASRRIRCLWLRVRLPGFERF